MNWCINWKFLFGSFVTQGAVILASVMLTAPLIAQLIAQLVMGFVYGLLIPLLGIDGSWLCRRWPTDLTVDAPK